MLDTRTGTSTALARETLRWRARELVVIEAIEAQDADSPCLATIVVCPLESTSLGCALIQAPTAIPGGQIIWSGELSLRHDEEVRAYFDGTVANDRLFLTVKVRDPQPKGVKP